MTGINALTAAELSQAAYTPLANYQSGTGPTLPSGWVAVTSNGLSAASSDGTSQFITFVNSTTKQVVIAFKGTDNGTNLVSDLANDGAVAYSSIQSAATTALTGPNGILQQYSTGLGWNIMTDGHSLGGGMAATFAVENDLNGYGQNALPIAKASMTGDSSFSTQLTTWQGNATFSDTVVAGDPATVYYGAQILNNSGDLYVGSITVLQNPNLNSEYDAFSKIGINLFEDADAAYYGYNAHSINTVVSLEQAGGTTYSGSGYGIPSANEPTLVNDINTIGPDASSTFGTLSSATLTGGSSDPFSAATITLLSSTQTQITANMKTGTSESDILTNNSDGSVTDVGNGYSGSNLTGTNIWQQSTTTSSGGAISSAITGAGDITDLSSAAITLGSAVQATVDGVSNAITAAANAVLTLAAGSSSNTVTATGAATVDDSGHSDSTTAANGSTVNIQGTSGNADSVAMNYGTLNLGTDVVGNLSGQHDTVNVQAASDANTGGTSLTVNMLGAGSTLVDTGTNDLDTVDAANITAYLQGAGSSVTANSASDGLVLQANNQTGTLQGAGGSITAYGNTSAIIMDGSGETGSMYGSNGAITVYGASDGSYMTGVNDTDALMGGNDGAIVQNHNDGVYDYSTGSGAAITNSDLGSWITGTFTTGGETVGVNASINSNGTITYSESSSGNYAHTAGGTVSLASDVMVNDGSYFANTLNSASAGSVTDLYNVSSTISENDLNYTGLNDTGLLSGETIDRVSLPTLSLTFQYSGTTEEYFTMSEAGVGTAIFADNGAFESGTGALASLGGYGSGDGGGSDDGYGGDGFSGDEGEFEIANTSNMTTTGSGGASINFSTFNSALPQSSAALNESNVAENEINTIKQLAASGFNTDQAFYEGGRWAPGTTITWSMATLAGPDASPFSSYMGPQYTALVQQAFSEWAAASGLTFTQVADSAQSDIRVGFGDFNTAQSGVTGYTTYQYKDSLLQPDVIVRVEDPTQTALSGSGANATYSGTNSAIYQDILHEIGHALGLADNNDPNSVMYYQAGASNVTLDANDITGLQTLYEANSPLAPSASLGDEISVNSMVHQMTQANASYLATSSVGIAAASAATAEAQQTTLAANAAH